jgi:serine/threonine protein kinase
MKYEAWQQIDDLFQTVVEMDPSLRASFLDERCGDDHALRSQVESLLATDSLEWNLIEASALESGAVLLADDQLRLAPGEHIGHYEVLELLGKGGMGEVYLARDRVLNRRIAIKLLPSDYTQDPDRLLRFRREAQNVSALNHPNILTIHELGDFDGHKYIATELIEGETLRSRLTRGPLSVLDALDIVSQIAGALAAAHKAGITHRDIKPENIMLRPDGYVKVLDFGLAKLSEQSETAETEAPATTIDMSSKALMGTPRYMSPEQVAGFPADARSDIFSLGSVFYEMLCGRPPFTDKEPGNLAASILHADPALVSDHLDTAPAGLVMIVEKMLKKDRRDRYQDAGELLTDLKLLREELVLEPKRTSHSNRRARSLVFAIGLICVAGLAFVAYSFFAGSPTFNSVRRSDSDSGGWSIKGEISAARAQVQTVVLDRVLYVTGGWNTCTPFGNLEAYDPASDSWKQLSPMPTARGAHGAAVLNGQIYVAGGMTDCGVATTSVEVYEPTTNSWSVKAPLPSVRYGHLLVAVHGKLYAIGGRSTEDEDLATNSRYDPETGRWEEAAPMTTPRWGAAAAVVNGVIYVIGGARGAGRVATVEAYDPVTNSWTSKRSMLLMRRSPAASELNGIIYVFGGSGNQNNVEAYDPTNDYWTLVAEMPDRRSLAHAVAFDDSIVLVGGTDGSQYLSSVISFTPKPIDPPRAENCLGVRSGSLASMPTARGGMSVGAIGGIVYVVGGYDWKSVFLATNEAYDPRSDSWTVKSPMPTAREMRGSNNAVVAESLYVIGGNAAGTCTDANERYDPKNDTWSTRAPMPTARCHHSVVAHGGLIYAIGGTNTIGSKAYDTVEIYDPVTDTWTHGVPMPSARMDSAAVSMDGAIVVIGGLNLSLSPNSLTTVEAYDPITREWKIKGSMINGRSTSAAGVIGRSILVVGGYSNESTLGNFEVYHPDDDKWTVLPGSSSRAHLSGVALDDTLYAFGGRADLEALHFQTLAESFKLEPCTRK